MKLGRFFLSVFKFFFLLYCVCSNDERDHMLVTSNPPVAALRTHVPSGVSPLSGEDAWLEANFTDSLSGINDYYHKWDAIISYNNFVLSKQTRPIFNTHIIWLLFSVDTTFPHYTITTILHKRLSSTKHNHMAAGPHQSHYKTTWHLPYVRLYLVWITWNSDLR